jgi:hypothetical protein
MIEVPCFEDWEGGIVELKDSNWVRRAFAFDIPSEGRVVMLNSSMSAFSLVLGSAGDLLSPGNRNHTRRAKFSPIYYFEMYTSEYHSGL